MPEDTFLFAFNGSISCPATSHKEAAAAFKDLVNEIGALAEAKGFRVFYIDPLPFDPQEIGYRGREGN